MKKTKRFSLILIDSLTDYRKKQKLATQDWKLSRQNILETVLAFSRDFDKDQIFETQFLWLFQFKFLWRHFFVFALLKQKQDGRGFARPGFVRICVAWSETKMAPTYSQDSADYFAKNYVQKASKLFKLASKTTWASLWPKCPNFNKLAISQLFINLF